MKRNEGGQASARFGGVSITRKACSRLNGALYWQPESVHGSRSGALRGPDLARRFWKRRLAK